MTIPDIKIFKAKKVITMNSYCPYGTHVAVKEGKILGVGSLDQLEGWGDYELDEIFSEKILRFVNLAKTNFILNNEFYMMYRKSWH